MSETFYRIQDADRDVAELLDPATWQSRPWVGELWKRCPDCYEGWVQVFDEDGRAVFDRHGEPEFEICGTCRGSSEVEDVRYGVSACQDLDQLYRYFAERDAELDGCVLVELRGRRAEDDDHEWTRGAILVWPTEIVSVTSLDPAEIEAVA